MTNGHSFVTVNPMTPVGPAEDLFIAGVTVFEITDFEPPLQRVTVIGINLPEPGVFGPFDEYVATLQATGDPTNVIATFELERTRGDDIWAGSALLDFGGTLFPITATVRPVLDDQRVGPVILQGEVFGVSPDSTVSIS